MPSMESEGSVTHALVLVCPRCGQANRVPIARLDERAKCGRCHQVLREAGEPIPVDGSSLQALVTASQWPVLVDFWAPWCGPCRMMGPELDRLARKMAGQIVVAKLNTDESPEAAMQYGAHSIPLLVLFSGGREVWRAVGARSAAQLERELRTALTTS